MTPHLDPNHYFLLKKRVLHESGIKDIVPSDCKYLSLTIFNKINKRISETTLKRVYGFAHAEFKPSLFTINALSEYCGLENWQAWQKECNLCNIHGPAAQFPWHKTLERATEISRTTLQVLKNKCGIPYERTIRRQFVNDHLNAFLKGDAIATVMLAPTGYGKTIALCHWIDEFMQDSYAAGQRDIVLFFSGSALINAYESGHNLNNWLQALLGLDHHHFLNDLFWPESGFEGRFYLIIDGLDEVYYKGHHFANIFEQLNDIISLQIESRRLRIITTMRSATWCNHDHHLTRQESWFTGFPVNGNRCVNVPLMDRQELRKLTQKIDPAFKDEVSERAVKTLGLPVFYQYYYRKVNHHSLISRFDEPDEFDVIAAYVLNKIYKSKHSIDMITFIREFLGYLNQGNKINNVNKLKVNHLIKTYNHAYEELINIGYLINMNDSHDVQLENYIRFGSHKLMEHSLAKKFYFDNDEKFDEKLIADIKNELPQEHLQVSVLKWCIYQTISSGRNIYFKILAGFETTLSYKSDLIAFLTKLLERVAGSGASLNHINFDTHVSEYFVGLEYANVSYEQALHTILTFNLTAKEEILLKCSLCVIAILELDIHKLEKLADNLRDYPAENFESFMIDPLSCIDTVLYYLKYGIVKTEALAELTRFYFNPPKTAFLKERNSFNEVLFMLGIHTLWICKNPAKTLRFIDALDKVYPNGSTAYRFLITVCTIGCLISAGKIDAAEKLYTPFAEKFEANQHGLTPIMKVYFKGLKVQMTALQADRVALLAQVKTLVKLCDEYSYKLLKVSNLAFMLTEFNCDEDISEETLDDYYFDMVRTVRACGCRTESFYEAKDHEH